MCGGRGDEGGGDDGGGVGGGGTVDIQGGCSVK